MSSEFIFGNKNPTQELIDLGLKNLNLALDAGHIKACLLMGNLSFYKNPFVEKNFKKAAQLFLAAAMQGDVEGRYMFGICRMEGLGVDLNIPAGKTFMQQAVAAGHVKAQMYMGLHYEEKEKDYDSAAYYYHLAAQNNNQKAMIRLADCWMELALQTLERKKAINLCVSAMHQNWVAQDPHFKVSSLNDETNPFPLKAKILMNKWDINSLQELISEWQSYQAT